MLRIWAPFVKVITSITCNIWNNVRFLSRIIISCAIPAFEVLMAAILYKYNYERQQVPDPNNQYRLPKKKLLLKAGFYLECAAGGLFILTQLLSFLDIMYYDRRDTQSVTPLVNEENPKINEKVKKTIESKKDNEKLVIEDLTEKKAEKKKWMI